MSACFLTGLLQRLTLIVGGVRAAVAARGGRDRAMVPLVVLAHGWLGRLLRRFDALVARLAAGRAPRGPRGPRTAAAPGAGVKQTRLPQGAAWLVRRMQETAAFGSQLQALLADPAMAALLAEAPAARRILRPLCRMLAVEMPALSAWATPSTGDVARLEDGRRQVGAWAAPAARALPPARRVAPWGAAGRRPPCPPG